MVDFHGWAATVDPAVIDDWLEYASLDPEAFGLAFKQQKKIGGNGGTNMVSAKNAAKLFSARYGK